MITFYTKAGCQGCRMSKMFLDRNNIAYNTVDVTEDPTALDVIRELGYMSLPVITTATDKWSGYNPDKLNALKTA